MDLDLHQLCVACMCKLRKVQDDLGFMLSTNVRIKDITQSPFVCKLWPVCASYGNKDERSLTYASSKKCLFLPGAIPDFSPKVSSSEMTELRQSTTVPKTSKRRALTWSICRSVVDDSIRYLGWEGFYLGDEVELKVLCNNKRFFQIKLRSCDRLRTRP